MPSVRAALYHRAIVPTLIAFLAFLASGIAGLGYEIAWTRMFAGGLGHEVVSLLAVLAAYFGGFALGAFTLDRRIGSSAVPGRWYAGLELVVGGWAAVSIGLIPSANRAAAALLGADPSWTWLWFVSFAVPFVVLLPATAAMGATLPAMERFVARLRGSDNTVAGLYAVNTAGAVIGTLATTALLVRALGFRASLLVLAVLNVAAALALVLGPGRGERHRNEPGEQGKPAEDAGLGRVPAVLLVTGLLGIGFEVVGVRVLSQVLEDTVYTFAGALAVFLLFTALGAALYQRLAPPPDAAALTHLLPNTGLACLASIIVMSEAATIYDGLHATLGGGQAAALTAEAALAVSVFALPATLMGATFSHLARLMRRSDRGIGRALGLNTLGAAAAPLLFGVVLLPAIGAKAAIAAIGFGYVVLAPGIGWKQPAGVAALGAALLVLPVNLVLVQPEPGGEIVETRTGVMAAVSIERDADGGLLLRVNNHFAMGGTRSAFGERRQAFIPLLLHPGPRKALFLGVGTGITMGAATVFEELRVDGAELVPEVVDLMPYFAEFNFTVRDIDAAAVVVSDARRFVAASRQSYDVIVGDVFHPARDGAGSLYTLEHFEHVSGALAEGGLFCQWLPLHQLDTETLRLIVRTFNRAFPNSTAVILHFNAETPAMGLIGSRRPVTLPPGWYEERTSSVALRQQLTAVDLSGPLDVLTTMLADRASLEAFAGDGPVNTDDRPLVTYTAPRFAYRADARPHTALTPILESAAFDPGTLLEAADPDLTRRLGSHIAARNTHVLADVHRVDERLHEALEGYLEALADEPEFIPSYILALLTAQQLAATDLAAAIDATERLAAIRPDRNEAQVLLRSMGR